jgi:hypothetical protein
MSNDMAELEQDLECIFRELEAGMLPSKEQIATLKYACGFNPKPVCLTHLDAIFNEFNTIFGVKK